MTVFLNLDTTDVWARSFFAVVGYMYIAQCSAATLASILSMPVAPMFPAVTTKIVSNIAKYLRRTELDLVENYSLIGTEIPFF